MMLRNRRSIKGCTYGCCDVPTTNKTLRKREKEQVRRTLQDEGVKRTSTDTD